MLHIAQILQVVTLVTGMQTDAIPDIQIREMPVARLRVICDTASSDLWACTRRSNGKIWMLLPDDFDQRNPEHLAVLAHELTHVVQMENGVFSGLACKQESEGPAYAVQNYILKTNGLPSVPQASVVQASAC